MGQAMMKVSEFKKIPETERWYKRNRRTLRERIEACQLWMNAPIITDAYILAENKQTIKRLRLCYGVDLPAELSKMTERARPTKGDIVETTTRRYGHILWVNRSGGGGTVCVNFGAEQELMDYEDFSSYSSHGGRTRWYVD